GVKEFFEQEVAQLRATLGDAEARVRDWKAARALVLPAEQKALLLRQIREVEGERERSSSRGRALRTQVDAARSLIAGTTQRGPAAEAGPVAVGMQQLRERLAKLESDRARLLTTYFAGAAPVKTIESEIAELRRLIARQDKSEIASVATEPNPLRRQLEQSVNQDTVALEGLVAELSVHDRQLATLRAELRQIDEADATLTQLDRERTIAEQTYLTAVKQLTEAGVEAELDVSRISNVTVAMPPNATLQPVYPRKVLVMALALVVGLVAGVALAIA